ncbi:putative dynein intermediate chain [Leptomonas pyrrhocoris]|uniref:Dynein axonemal intermediate chain 4 n=1 Tax=Leptomonas pyrrhocoris TaxID=157538 RepID=A0A0M9G7S9_LEPPY|nr:putative dynein intermediate chain [Leptomonas pyrrhocoris]KPA84337.1 putative dynein intermediate chain [Leptomonas pyrrhocoris]|eukprot:XP_015662776.1 putative dynein intermediate chain [Leptomonas pyrrhocoris]
MHAASDASKASRTTRSTVGVSNSTAGCLHTSSASRYSVRNKSHMTSSTRGSGGTAAARDEAKRRLQDLKGELEGAVHVLDGGVNRTPLPLQQHQSLVGGLAYESQGGPTRLDMTQDSSTAAALMNAEIGASFLQSSFMLGSSMRNNARKQSSVSAEAESSITGIIGVGGGGGQRSRRGGDSSSKSMESSTYSLSFANDRRLTEQSSSVIDSSAFRTNNTGGGGSSVLHRGSSTSNQIPHLVQQNTLLSEAAYVQPAPLSEEKKAAWRKAITTITLTETPTIFLYNHHDEAVSKEDVEEVAAVKARNKAYAGVEEAYRTDEGTRFHSTGVATMRAPLKSIQTEVHPPAKKDSGGLQVTTWMLKDAYEAALEGMNGGDDDENDDAQQQKEAAAAGSGGGDVDDVLREDGGGDEGADFEVDDDANSEEAQSTVLSSDEATTNTPSTAADGTANAKTGLGLSKQWMLADTVLSTLRVMERAVVQNYMEAAQLAYRGIEVDPASRRVQGKASSGNNQNSSGRGGRAAAAKGGAAAPPPLPPSPATAQKPLPPLSADAAAGATKDTRDLVSAPQQLVPRGERDSKPDAGADGTSGGAATAPTIVPGFTVALRMSEDVRFLWRFGSGQLTRNRGVACMTWNRRELDMLAVGYTACRTSGARANQRKSNGAAPPSSQSADPIDLDVNDGGMVLKRSMGQEAKGMICCWSLKNPLAPELILFLCHEADVTALAFSSERPSLLAVGSSAGEIVVYDIQRDVVYPSIAPAAGATAGQHTGAIWELQWVPKGKEHGEFLTSISADGRVVQWAVGKSIERVAPDLMHLQRQPGTQVEQAFVDGVAEAEAVAAAADSAVAAAGGGKGRGKLRPSPPPTQGTTGNPTSSSGGRTNGSRGNGGGNKDAGGGGVAGDEAVLSRQCGGMCFDVCPIDTAIYVVGTEDGSVLQCSKSQTENYDFEYESHAELVYRVRWSPYSAAYFLTCSADWTSRLYKVGTSKAQLRFNSVRQDAVQDVAWSPTNALIFATATAQGSAEVWTVADVMYPRDSIEFEDHRHLSAILFAEQETPVLVVGDEEGDVTVFLLEGACYTRQDLTDDEQEVWMDETVRKQLT